MKQIPSGQSTTRELKTPRVNAKSPEGFLSKDREIPSEENNGKKVPKKNDRSPRNTIKAAALGAGFTQALAREIVKNLAALGEITSRPFHRTAVPETKASIGEHPTLVDTSVFIDGRILPIVNSGFLLGTLIVPQFVLAEIQHIADETDPLRRAKGRRALDVINKLKNQKVNPWAQVKIVSDNPKDVSEVDSKLVMLAKMWEGVLLTVDFNLAHVARAHGVRVLNVNDLAQALKVALVAGEEFTIKITHEGREREQGVGYLPDGTMVVVENTKDKVNQELRVVVTKIHSTPAGQLFFARMK